MKTKGLKSTNEGIKQLVKVKLLEQLTEFTSFKTLIFQHMRGKHAKIDS